MGRHYKQIEKRLFESLCGLQCDINEIASCLECDNKTLENWCKREYGKNFSEVFEEKKARGKISLRRTQWKLAEKSPAMAIFLGKNYLGQRDEQNVEIKGEIGITSLADLMLEEYRRGQNENAKSAEI